MTNVMPFRYLRFQLVLAPIYMARGKGLCRLLCRMPYFWFIQWNDIHIKILITRRGVWLATDENAVLSSLFFPPSSYFY